MVLCLIEETFDIMLWENFDIDPVCGSDVRT